LIPHTIMPMVNSKTLGRAKLTAERGSADGMAVKRAGKVEAFAVPDERRPVGQRRAAAHHPAHVDAAFEAQAAQRQLGPGRPATEVDPQIDALGRRQHHVVALQRRGQQTAIRADHGQRRSIVPGQLVAARVRCVEQTQAVGAALDGSASLQAAVDQHPVAEHAHHGGHHRAHTATHHPAAHHAAAHAATHHSPAHHPATWALRLGRVARADRAVQVDELVVGIEIAILDHEREVLRAAGQAERALLVVADQEQAGESRVHLLASAAMRMRVEPVAAGAVDDHEVVDVALAGRDREARVTVHGLGHMQAMPMDDGRLGQAVDQVDADALAATHADDGRQHRRIQHAGVAAQQA
jgi:hypothetical protein